MLPGTKGEKSTPNPTRLADRTDRWAFPRLRSRPFMVSRRAVLAASVPTVLAATAGCSAILGSGAEFSSKTATVSADARAGTGYEEAAIEDVVIERTFSAAGQERTVSVTNRAARYERQVDLPALPAQRAAVFVAFTSPKIDLFGKTFNPIGEMSNRELLALIQDRYTGISVGSKVGEHEATMLGQAVTIEKFQGSATLAGASVDTLIHVTRVEHGGDYVLAVAVYPRLISDEDGTVERLVEGIEHGG